MPDAESHGEEQEQNTGRLAYLAELQCFMCGSLAGSIEADRKPLPPYGIWHPAGGGPAQRVAYRRQLRCGRWGGSLFPEAVAALVPPAHDVCSPRGAPRRA